MFFQSENKEFPHLDHRVKKSGPTRPEGIWYPQLWSKTIQPWNRADLTAIQQRICCSPKLSPIWKVSQKVCLMYLVVTVTSCDTYISTSLFTTYCTYASLQLWGHKDNQKIINLPLFVDHTLYKAIFLGIALWDCVEHLIATDLSHHRILHFP